MSFFPHTIHRNRCRLGLRPRPHWGSFQCFPDGRSPSWFQRAASRQEGNEGEGREGLGGGGERKGRERGKGRSWGSSALVVGGIDAPEGQVMYFEVSRKATRG